MKHECLSTYQYYNTVYGEAFRNFFWGGSIELFKIFIFLVFSNVTGPDPLVMIKFLVKFSIFKYWFRFKFKYVKNQEVILIFRCDELKEILYLVIKIMCIQWIIILNQNQLFDINLLLKFRAWKYIIPAIFNSFGIGSTYRDNQWNQNIMQ